jgi:hypothetical protein
MTSDAEQRTQTPLDIPLRQAQLPAAGRELHRTILRAFLDNGRPPERDELRSAAAGLGLDIDIALRGLAKVDLVHVDADGRVRVAYPFSGRDTGIRVRLQGGPEVDAMCAVDALGIPPMAGRDGVIVATDPQSRQPIRVESVDGRWSWQPEEAVVLYAGNDDSDGTGAITADSTCPMITFHANAGNAVAYLESRPDAQGKVLSRDQALEVAVKLFGDLLGSD